MKSLKFYLLGLIVLGLLSGCVIKFGPPPTNPQILATSVLSPTVIASPSETPQPTVTPFPTPTQRATSTEFPTLTPVPQPSLTHQVFVEKGMIPSPTSNQTTVPFINITATPASLQCDVRETYPSFAQTFKPLTEFKASWRVYNVGTAPWGLEDILLEYVSGDKLQFNRGDDSKFIGYTVYVADRIRFEVRMKAPKEPGRYSTTWGLRRSNKKDPFCTFSITIDVVK